MSQEQPRRPRAEPIKYGDVFNVSGELASERIAPQDAAAMQSAESQALGKTQKGGAAAVMQSAADFNERKGFVARSETNIFGNPDVTVTKSFRDGDTLVTESVAGQAVAQYIEPMARSTVEISTTGDQNKAITIGQALETAAWSAGHKKVNESDAAAIQAAEMIVPESNEILPDGVAEEAQSAVTQNTQTLRYQDTTKLRDIFVGNVIQNR